MGVRRGRWLRTAAVLALSAGLSACGVFGYGSPASSRAASGAASGVPVLHPPAAQLLPVVAWQSTPSLNGAGSARLQADLTGSGVDLLTVRVDARGHGSLIVQGSGGLHWVLPHVAAVSVLEFGARHLPVLVVQGGSSYCGSGGCTYGTYTWDAGLSQFVAVPPPGETAYRYNAARHRVQMVSVPAPDGLFGFVAVSHRGILLTVRLYDLWQHVETLTYAYAENNGPTGEWREVGSPQYQPTAWEGVPFSSAATALQGLLEARALDIAPQGLPLVAEGVQEAVWRQLAPLAALGASMGDDGAGPTAVAGADGQWAVMDQVSGTAGAGFAQHLRSYVVTANVQHLGAGYVVTSVALKPTTLRVATPLAVLQRCLTSAVGRSFLTGSRGAPLLVFPVGLSWQVEVLRGRSTSAWLQVNAVTGRVAPASRS